MTIKTKAIIILGGVAFVMIVASLFRSSDDSTNGHVTLTFTGYTNDATGKPIAMLVLSNQSSRAIIPYMYIDRPAAGMQSARSWGSGTMAWNAIDSGRSLPFVIPRSPLTDHHRFSVSYAKHNWAFRLWATLFKLHLYRLQQFLPNKWIELEETSTTD